MITSYPHNNRYRPPFPSLDIVLRSPEDGLATASLAVLIDTGADITSIPLRHLVQVHAPELDEVRLRSHWGHAVTVITYMVDIEIMATTLPGIEVVGDVTSDEIVLGRDVLNHLVLLIDGQRSTTTILDQRPRLAEYQ